MAHFPKLIPAFIAHVVIDAPFPLGTLSKGAPLSVIPFLAENSYIKSQSGYAIELDSVFVHGSDYIKQDPSGKHLRLDVSSVVKDASGAFVVFKYTGVINITEGVKKVLGGDAEARTTPFGDSFTHVVFETGDAKLKAIEDKVYVASGHFIIEAGKPTVVEYLISEVTV
ncbi:hypothetical protein B7494_g3140 [Chlorociboria aeruginascens]|nr:hypothetical protein B7494_g3140 [Chlorociboria aeruginascens]